MLTYIQPIDLNKATRRKKINQDFPGDFKLEQAYLLDSTVLISK
jgi:hypothetical protein